MRKLGFLAVLFAGILVGWLTRFLPIVSPQEFTAHLRAKDSKSVDLLVPSSSSLGKQLGSFVAIENSSGRPPDFVVLSVDPNSTINGVLFRFHDLSQQSSVVKSVNRVYGDLELTSSLDDVGTGLYRNEDEGFGIHAYQYESGVGEIDIRQFGNPRGTLNPFLQD